MTIPFTYFLKHKQTGLKYYGLRYRKGCKPSDLWVKYFSSSKKVHELIKIYGKDSFEYEVRKIFTDSKKAIEWEINVLKKMNVLKRNDWLNESVAGSVIHTPSTLLKMSNSIKQTYIRNGNKNKGRVVSVETKNKQSEKRKGRPSPNKGKSCPESAKLKKSIIMKSKIKTEEHNKKNSDRAKLRKRIYLPDGKWKWGLKDSTIY